MVQLYNGTGIAMLMIIRGMVAMTEHLRLHCYLLSICLTKITVEIVAGTF